jgi:nitrate reductase molybdenum cofactor assembly chaperone NarJ/NarW
MADQQHPQPAHGPSPAEPERDARASTPGTAGNAGDAARRDVFIAAARLLAYPDRALWMLLPEIEERLRELPASDALSQLMTVAQRLRATGVAELETRYVATFDFNEATSLYLTAHELGDSRRRGQALVELRAMLRASGFEEATEELPDYLPLLLEFLAYAPADTPLDALERRLAAVCDRISTNLDADSLYRAVFVALCGVLPAPEESNPERRFTQREQADRGEMPYPLQYD